MPVYEFRCKSCGMIFEDDHPSEVVGATCGACGGTMRRVWAINVNKENIRAVPRG